ncbi:MAG: hypothetical protein WDO19_25240 [Bacteroidota bacterium]
MAISGSGCQATMAGSASVTAGVLPTAYAVTGGGSYCSGPGVTVGLERSQNNITILSREEWYQHCGNTKR